MKPRACQEIAAIAHGGRLLVRTAVLLACLLLSVRAPLLAQAASAPAPKPATGARALPFVVIKDKQYILLKDVAGFYGMKCLASGKLARLTSKYSNLLFTEGKRDFSLNGQTASLSYVIARYKGNLAISVSDITEFVDPILRTGILKPRTIRHIVLDPGHGGKDPGTMNGGINEKSVNLLIAKRVAAILQKRGYVVTVLRLSDKDMTLKQRVEAAKKVKPDLYLSLHCNAAEDTSISGIETYVPNPRNTPSSGGNTVAKTASPSNAVDRENALLGYTLQKALVAATKATDRGIKRKQFYVIRQQACPAALIEIGFLSNENERKKLCQSEYHDKLAVAICDAVQKYENILKPKKKK